MDGEMNNMIVKDAVEERIHVIRGKQVMLDRDLAELYGVETKVLNQSVKRNMERFPKEFMFQLTKDEQVYIEMVKKINLKSQNVTSSWGGTRKLSYAFTEQGVAMLSGVLRSPTAVAVSIQIMNAFVQMRHFLQNNAEIFVEIKSIKRQLLDSDIHQKEADKRIDELFEKMDRYAVTDIQGIFFQGQIFDAYAKFESFIAQANKDLILIDGYVDLSVLERLAKKRSGVSVQIFTSSKTKLIAQDIQKFNTQYPTLTVSHTTKMHDRFLIIDGQILYHIGASLKDLGKKCFAFEVLDSSLIPTIMQNL